MPRGPIERVLLAIATRGRPRLAAACLASAGRVEVPPGVTFEILLVDNNAGGEARQLVERLGPELEVPLRYAHVPEPGIVGARNRAVEEALAWGADAVGMVDDDDLFDPRWLIEGLAAFERYGCDVVVGPVHLILPEETPSWFSHAFPDPNRPAGVIHGTGPGKVASTNNVLFRVHLVREWGLRFPPAYNLGGGEDTYFFNEARDRGAITAWAPAFTVSEEVPRTRISLRWFLLRRLRIGNSFRHMEHDLGYRPTTWLVQLHYVGHVLEKGLLWPALALLTLDLRVDHWVQMAGRTAYSLGGLLACFGYRYLEYRQVHGD